MPKFLRKPQMLKFLRKPQMPKFLRKHNYRKVLPFTSEAENLLVIVYDKAQSCHQKISMEHIIMGLLDLINNLALDFGQVHHSSILFSDFASNFLSKKIYDNSKLFKEVMLSNIHIFTLLQEIPYTDFDDVLADIFFETFKITNIVNYEKQLLQKIDYRYFFYSIYFTYLYAKCLIDIPDLRLTILQLILSIKFEKENISYDLPRLGLPRRKSEFLMRFGEDLTKKVIENHSDPLIGREKEIKKILQILGRRRKNNPILVGDAGVGKTAIIEGVAKLLIDGENIAETLQNSRFMTLKIGRLLAGTRYRGEFEKRISGIITEIQNAKNIIMIIDEIHTIIGAGTSDKSFDTANLLKPPLSRGEFRCIGTSSFNDYNIIEKDNAFARRFQKLIIEEPSLIETIEIL